MTYNFDNIGNASFGSIQLKFLNDKKTKGNVPHQKDEWILKTYKSMLGNFRPKSILEIGINTGGSLIMWNKLFGCKVVGVDITYANINQPAMKYINNHQDIKMYKGNSSIKKRIDHIMSIEFPNGADMIIDDGAHNLAVMIPTLDNLWEYANKLYVVEDWKALSQPHRIKLLGKLTQELMGYWPDPSPGKKDPWKFEMYKRLIAIWRRK